MLKELEKNGVSADTATYVGNLFVINFDNIEGLTLVLTLLCIISVSNYTSQQHIRATMLYYFQSWK